MNLQIMNVLSSSVMNEIKLTSEFSSGSKIDEAPILIETNVNAFMPVDDKPNGITPYFTLNSSGLIGKLEVSDALLSVTLKAFAAILTSQFAKSYKNFDIHGTDIRVELSYDEISHISMSQTGLVQIHVKDPQNVIGFSFNSNNTNEVLAFLKNKNVQIDTDVGFDSNIAKRSFQINWLIRIAVYAFMLGFIGFILYFLKTNGAI